MDAKTRAVLAGAPMLVRGRLRSWCRSGLQTIIEQTKRKAGLSR